MSIPYPYKPGTYKPADKKKPAVEKFQALAKRRWGFRNLGTLVVRPMNSDEKTLSVHATGNAADQGYTNTAADRKKAIEACRWYTRPDVAEKLGIVAVHDYMANPPRAWRCDRAEWRSFPNGELGPAYHGIHIEIGPRHAALSAKEFEMRWRSLPKPA